MVFLGALLTALNVYDNIGKFAGARSIVPITGFANSIVSPAMEFRSEGSIMGVGTTNVCCSRPRSCLWYFFHCVGWSNIFSIDEVIDMAQKVGNQTFVLDRKVYWKEGVCIVGPKEKEGPLGKYFDQKENEDFGEDTWEKAEARFVEATYAKLLTKSQINENMVDCIFAGDLLNQCIATGNGLKTGRPYFGLYGACSTMASH